jgi:hypothetical protein
VGVKFVCKLDKDKNLYFVPSHKNYFGDAQVSNLIADPGCAGILLALDGEQDLHTLFAKFSTAEYMYKVADTVGSAGVAHILVVKPKSTNSQFKVQIGVDRFGDSATVFVKLLRFQLTSQDCAVILSMPEYSLCLISDDQEKLRVQSLGTIPRLSVSLLGNLVLDSFEWLKAQDIIFFVDITKLPANFLSTLPELAVQCRQPSVSLTQRAEVHLTTTLTT